ncbi:diacylglycerol kinase, putative [Entamoeba invadens IP1]|uniref:diacylglycerol kinase, putative n=1 Tax=Entamoeba invadens IP1 TaxID=370355 RepID=UPI0002C3D7AC|nr:diacylglycerol kinase, putative [Entamoeba invadens IP1]ELP85432.1 diacylglycerol kinase, putative [Entamoeba invadens IP1]|eukprot:XP_004184778.1 diacylglycerol kinase, putative [Entamoeba invadens IP1]
MSIVCIPPEIGIPPEEMKNHNLMHNVHEFSDDITVGFCCSVCSLPIIGSADTCKCCKAKVHPSCSSKLVTSCFREEKGFITEGMANKHHVMKLTTFTSPTYCQVCEDMLVGVKNQGYRCDLCGMTAHTNCLRRVNLDCKSFEGKTDFCHHFVKGSKIGGKCNVCGDTLLASSLTSLRCVWCGITLHQGCINLAPRKCTYGSLHNIIIPPDYIEEATHIVKKIENFHPVVVVANPKSGGQTGLEVIKHCRFLLNPLQVFNMFEGWDKVFTFVSEYKSDFTIICAGGDGSVGWCLNECRKKNLFPKVVPMPLGTGNDLANSFKWGNGFDGKLESVKMFLETSNKSSLSGLDRWDLFTGSELKTTMNNYFSFGLSGEIVCEFHKKREANPKEFESQFKNKMTYVKAYLGNAVSAKDVGDLVEVKIGKRRIPVNGLVGLTFLNIPLYAAGAKPWGAPTESEKCYGWREGSTEDGVLELFGFTDAPHVAAVMGGVATAKKIAQCNCATIEVKADSVNCEIDGEPVSLVKGVYELKFAQKVNMLYKLM